MTVQSVIDATYTVAKLFMWVFALVSMAGASSHGRWTEACFWALIIILLEIRNITEK